MSSNLLHPSVFEVYDRKTGNMVVFYPQLGDFAPIDQIKAHTLKALRSSSKIEEIWQQESIIKLLNKSQLIKVRIQKFISQLDELGLLEVDPKASTPSQYNIDYQYKLKSDETLSLQFQTEPPEVSSRWARLLYYQLKVSRDIMNEGYVFSKSVMTKDEIKLKLETLLNLIKEFARKTKFLTYDIQNFEVVLENDVLNQLHQVFEDLYVIDEVISDPQFKSTLQEYNMSIHLAEEIISENQGAILEHVFTEAFGPASLLEEDYKYFSPNFLFGKIYLNYLQIGYSVLAAFENQNDLAEPYPQHIFNANHFLCFRPDYIFQKEKELNAWIKEKLSKDPTDPKLAIGHIPIASLKNSYSFEQICNLTAKIDSLQSISVSE